MSKPYNEVNDSNKKFGESQGSNQDFIHDSELLKRYFNQLSQDYK